MLGPSGTSSFFLLPRLAGSRDGSSTPPLEGGGGPRGMAPGGGKPGRGGVRGEELLHHVWFSSNKLVCVILLKHNLRIGIV